MRLYIPCNDLPHHTNHLCVCSESRDVFGQPSASYWSYGNIYVPAQSRTHIRHEWPGPVGTLIQVGLAWAVHDGYDIIN